MIANAIPPPMMIGMANGFWGMRGIKTIMDRAATTAKWTGRGKAGWRAYSQSK
jgi:hypothetical protein